MTTENSVKKMSQNKLRDQQKGNMKQPNFIQTKLNYSSKPPKFVQIDGKSIDVDNVKVYEIKEKNPPQKTIDIDPVYVENIQRQQKMSVPWNHEIRRQQSLKRFATGERSITKEQPEDKLNISTKNTKKNRPSPFDQYMFKIQKIISQFLQINEAIPSLKITSQQFYNISQTRKKLLLTNLSKPRDFYEAQYTNILSFLHFLVQVKQRDYEIYEQLQQLEKILYIIENEIQELTEIYINEEEAKVKQLFSQELIDEIRELSVNCDLMHKKQKETLIIDQKTYQNPILNQFKPQSQVQEGQMDMNELSNKSLPIQPLELCQKTPGLIEQFEAKEKQIQIELEEVIITNKKFTNQSNEKLISSFEEKLIYSVSQNQLIIESQSNSQKCQISSNHMEIEEQI